MEEQFWPSLYLACKNASSRVLKTADRGRMSGHPVHTRDLVGYLEGGRVDESDAGQQARRQETLWTF